MKHIIDHLKENWIRHGFETIVVTVGILAAFGLNNWNENRKREILEIKYIKRLKVDLVQDTLYFKNRMDKARKFIADYTSGVHLAYETQNNVNQVRTLLGFYAWTNENLTTQSDTYLELISAGNLDILENDSLKNMIMAYYRVVDQYAKHILEFNTFTAGMGRDVSSDLNFMKYHPYNDGLFDSEMLLDSDWSFLNDPSSESFKKLENLAATYRAKHILLSRYYPDLKSRSKTIVKMLDAEVARLEGQ